MTQQSAHEIKDPIHNFIYLSNAEREVINAAPVQRLRYIHQLSLSYLIYPGATHRRFEHSLGVMHLADRAYNAIWKNQSKSPASNIFPADIKDKEYWRSVVRMAALCHDLGHLPFSHGAEHLLPDKKNHEDLSVEIIRNSTMQKHWDKLGINTEHIIMVAVGAKTYEKTGTQLAPWERVMAEIVVGDAFGVDRMDYLLRDSFHTGVANGGFDHQRLLDRLCVLPEGGSSQLTLGLDHGGLQASEAMLLARYFLFDQLYFHPVRKIYDEHLIAYLRAALGTTLQPSATSTGYFSTNLGDHLTTTDNEVLAAIGKAARDPDLPGHTHAHRIETRDHYRVLYRSDVHDQIPSESDRNKKFPEARRIYQEACQKFGNDKVIITPDVKGPGGRNFPVRSRLGQVESSLQISRLLDTLPSVEVCFVFIHPSDRGEATQWLKQNYPRRADSSTA